ncbi:MAG: sensor histidine kinase [Pseudomonadota bacterium]
MLVPLTIVMGCLSAWSLRDAQVQAADRFDRSLLITALGISRDTAFSGGNALREATRDLLRNTSGGAVFYHVYAPDGVFVTGYATPPRNPAQELADKTDYTFYNALYQNKDVRAVRFTDTMTIDGVSGPFTFTVWQNTSVRDGFVASLLLRIGVGLATIFVSVALIVWFGIKLGLAPLLDLEDAIQRRSVDDLSNIRRVIPPEVQGIVGRLNSLFGELGDALRSREEMISNAAHQLRNPIAGIVALAEAVRSARTLADANERSEDLLAAARHASGLTNDLLTLERAQAVRGPENYAPIDLGTVMDKLDDRFRARLKTSNAILQMTRGKGPHLVRVDPTLIEQALHNLVGNACAHAGPSFSSLTISLSKAAEVVTLTVADDGKGIDEQDHDAALERFNQVEPSAGSGLGLPIAKVVAERANGKLTLTTADPGLKVTLEFPVATENAKPSVAEKSKLATEAPSIIDRALSPAE